MPIRLPGELPLPRATPGEPAVISPLRSAVGGIGAAASAIAQFESAMANERARLSSQEQMVTLQEELHSFADEVANDPNDLGFLERFDAQFANAPAERSLNVTGTRYAQDAFRSESRLMLSTARARLSGEHYRRHAELADATALRAVDQAAKSAIRFGHGQEAAYAAVAKEALGPVASGVMAQARGDELELLGRQTYDLLDVRRQLTQGNYGLVIDGFTDKDSKRWRHLTAEQESAAIAAAKAGMEANFADGLRLLMVEHPEIAINALIAKDLKTRIRFKGQLSPDELDDAKAFMRDLENVAPRYKAALRDQAKAIQQGQLSESILFTLEDIGWLAASRQLDDHEDLLDPVLATKLARAIAVGRESQNRQLMEDTRRAVREHNARMAALSREETERVKAQQERNYVDIFNALEDAKNLVNASPTRVSPEVISAFLKERTGYAISHEWLENAYDEGLLSDTDMQAARKTLTQLFKGTIGDYRQRRRGAALDLGARPNLRDDEDREHLANKFELSWEQEALLPEAEQRGYWQHVYDFAAHHSGYVTDEVANALVADFTGNEVETQRQAFEHIVALRQMNLLSDIDSQFKMTETHWDILNKATELSTMEGVDPAEAIRNAMALKKPGHMTKEEKTSRYAKFAKLGLSRDIDPETGEEVIPTFTEGDFAGPPSHNPIFRAMGISPRGRPPDPSEDDYGNMGWYRAPGMVYDVIQDMKWEEHYGEKTGAKIRAFFTKDLKGFMHDKISAQHLNSQEVLRDWALTTRRIMLDRGIFHGNATQAAREAVVATLGSGMFAMEEAYVWGDPVLRRGGTSSMGDLELPLIDAVPAEVIAREDLVGEIFSNAHHVFLQEGFPWNFEPGWEETWHNYLASTEGQSFLSRYAGAALFAFLDLSDPHVQSALASIAHFAIQTGRMIPADDLAEGAINSTLGKLLGLHTAQPPIGGPDKEMVQNAVADLLRIQPRLDADVTDGSLGPVGMQTFRVRASKLHEMIQGAGMDSPRPPLTISYRAGDRWVEILGTRTDEYSGKIVQLNEPYLYWPSKKVADEQGNVLPPGKDGATYSPSARIAWRKSQRNQTLAQAEDRGFFDFHPTVGLKERFATLPDAEKRDPRAGPLTDQAFMRMLSKDPILRAHLAVKLAGRPIFGHHGEQFIGEGIGYSGMQLSAKAWLARIDKFLETKTDPGSVSLEEVRRVEVPQEERYPTAGWFD